VTTHLYTAPLVPTLLVKRPGGIWVAICKCVYCPDTRERPATLAEVSTWLAR
jgi:hypothetical protein